MSLTLINRCKHTRFLMINNADKVNSGDNDLNVTLASVPSYAHMPPPPPQNTSSSQPGSTGSCALPPLSVYIRSGNGKSVIRYVDWEESCRDLSQNIFSLVGTAEGKSRCSLSLVLSGLNSS